MTWFLLVSTSERVSERELEIKTSPPSDLSASWEETLTYIHDGFQVTLSPLRRTQAAPCRRLSHESRPNLSGKRLRHSILSEHTATHRNQRRATRRLTTGLKQVGTTVANGLSSTRKRRH